MSDPASAGRTGERSRNDTIAVPLRPWRIVSARYVSVAEWSRTLLLSAAPSPPLPYSPWQPAAHPVEDPLAGLHWRWAEMPPGARPTSRPSDRNVRDHGLNLGGAQAAVLQPIRHRAPRRPFFTVSARNSSETKRGSRDSRSRGTTPDPADGAPWYRNRDSLYRTRHRGLRRRMRTHARRTSRHERDLSARRNRAQTHEDPTCPLPTDKSPRSKEGAERGDVGASLCGGSPMTSWRSLPNRKIRSSEIASSLAGTSGLFGLWRCRS